MSKFLVNLKLVSSLFHSKEVFFLQEFLFTLLTHNKIEGKITECWLVNDEGTFFLNLLVKRPKLLALMIGSQVA